MIAVKDIKLFLSFYSTFINVQDRSDDLIGRDHIGVALMAGKTADFARITDQDAGTEPIRQ